MTAQRSLLFLLVAIAVSLVYAQSCENCEAGTCPICDTNTRCPCLGKCDEDINECLPPVLTITATSLSKIYGAPLPKLRVTYSGFVNGDTSANLTTLPTVITTATRTSPVGEYTITASGASDSTYQIEYVAGTLTVTQRTLTITPNSASKVYYANIPSFTFTYAGFAPGEKKTSLTTLPVATTNAVVSSPVGTYLISASGAVDANYAFTYTYGELTITQKPLYITAQNETSIQGQEIPAFKANYVGLHPPDTVVSSLSPHVTLSCSASFNSAGGIYPIVPCCAGSTNYALYYYDGYLTQIGQT